MEYSEFLKLIIDGDIESIKAAISEGYDINLSDKWGFLPLHRACANHQRDIVAWLIAKESNIQAKATDGWTPIHLASITGATDCLSLLVEAGADVNVEDVYGNTPLHLAVTYRNPELPGSDIELVSTLLALGGNKHAKNKEELTPLEVAQVKGRSSIYEVLS